MMANYNIASVRTTGAKKPLETKLQTRFTPTIDSVSSISESSPTSTKNDYKSKYLEAILHQLFSNEEIQNIAEITTVADQIKLKNNFN